MEPNTPIEERIRMHEGRLADCERDLQRLEMERLARHRFIALLKIAMLSIGTAFLAYWGTKHNWWAP